jgi:rare lipoprotein A
MNPNAMTAAHRSRPLGSEVTVTSHSTGRSVTVRINDRGPFVRGRCIDLSNVAARALGISGTAMVSLR